ncbi:MAG TPA: ethanolamine utilization protein, partial [Rhodocyclaceae bacterium]|nr:ethanolamine utilization protein [Rhodocyclaceae bacterium]
QIARREIPPDIFAAAVQALIAPPALPPHLDPTDIEILPEDHGVYVAYGENNTPLFVGKSHQLKKRVLAHFASERKSNKTDGLWAQTRRLESMACSGELGTLLREAHLLHTLRPRLNRQVRPVDETCFWALDASRPGQLQLIAAEELDGESGATLYGPFQTKREARLRLTELIKLNGLCPAVLGLEKHVPQQPCSARKLKQCKGACSGGESVLMHTTRLVGVLTKFKLSPWPFAGPALLREGDALHIIHHWRYLGSASDETEIHEHLQATPPAFDRETYRVLLKCASAMQALPAKFSVPAT